LHKIFNFLFKVLVKETIDKYLFNKNLKNCYEWLKRTDASCFTTDKYFRHFNQFINAMYDNFTDSPNGKRYDIKFIKIRTGENKLFLMR